ncbi:MAG: hypothetical protein ACTS22_01515 [Phycisphaerales bacterium]
MSEANPVDRSRFPLGPVLVCAGMLAILAIAAHGFYSLYQGTREVLGTIAGPEPTRHTLYAGTYVLTRSDELSDEKAIAATLDSIDGVFTPESSDRWISFNNDRNQILGTIVTDTAGEITLAVRTDAYPVHIRRDPLTHAKSVLLRAGVLGTLAAALLSAGVVMIIRGINERHRRSQREFNELIGNS